MLHFRIGIIINHFNTWIFSIAKFCQIYVSVYHVFLLWKLNLWILQKPFLKDMRLLTQITSKKVADKIRCQLLQLVKGNSSGC